MLTLRTNKILVPVDFSISSKRAIHHAAFLAQLNKGELILLNVHQRRTIFETMNPLTELRDEASEKKAQQQKLERMAKAIHKKYNIPVHPRMVNGHRIEGIIKGAEKFHADLIIMGTQGSESTSNLFLGNNSNRVLSRTAVPVMTVRSQAAKTGYSRIIVPVNLSRHSRQKVNYALQLAKVFAAGVSAVGIISPEEEVYRYKMEVILSQIKRLATEKNILFESLIVSSSDAAETTLQIAEQKKADLIVAMTDDNSNSGLFFQRSYDQHLVNESTVPVLSIPPEVAEESLETLSIAGY